MISLDALSQINRIIEHDKISSTYKFVLLKNTIDVCQRYDHLVTMDKKMATLPLGLIIEGWIFDYLPFVFSEIRQQHRGGTLRKPVELQYEALFKDMGLSKETTWNDAYATIFTKYLTLELTDKQSKIMLRLAGEIAKTIIEMPMRFTGDNEYEIFQPHKTSFRNIPKNENFNREFLIENFGSFSIKKEHYEIFRYMGQSLYGSSTIARRWKEVTYTLNQYNIQLDDIDKMIYKTIFDDRNTAIARKYLPDDCHCVWSGKKLKNGQYDIDHVLPYSIWFNNDLWNLLPCDPKVNNKKSNNIPSPELILKQKDLIMEYWDLYDEEAPNLFNYQVKYALSPSWSKGENKHSIIGTLCNKADYLIRERGYITFKL